ncbi:unnamed protein product [Durusdinium trenchii]|uniref:Uncharacterized protein n=2 Tax=Durusdinium trenchii TaxID=1381693 RepID=A0ABP0MCC4_9DINO
MKVQIAAEDGGCKIQLVQGKTMFVLPFAIKIDLDDLLNAFLADKSLLTTRPTSKPATATVKQSVDAAKDTSSLSSRRSEETTSTASTRRVGVAESEQKPKASASLPATQTEAPKSLARPRQENEDFKKQRADRKDKEGPEKKDIFVLDSQEKEQGSKAGAEAKTDDKTDKKRSEAFREGTEPIPGPSRDEPTHAKEVGRHREGEGQLPVSTNTDGHKHNEEPEEEDAFRSDHIPPSRVGAHPHKCPVQ